VDSPCAKIRGKRAQNVNLLKDLRLIVGTQYHTEDNTTSIDVAALFTQRKEAALLAVA